MLPAVPFFIVRHGQTEANLAQILTGISETPLTDLGREQARAIHKVITTLEVKPTAIIHSNLSRAHETALIINECLDVPMHEEPDLAGRNLGDWEGQHRDKCEAKLNDPSSPPNGEDFFVFFDRIKKGLSKALPAHDAPILIVTHNGAFRALGGMHGFPLVNKAKNCHLYEFQPAPEKPDFPWDVFSYEYDETQNRVICARETLYDDADN